MTAVIPLCRPVTSRYVYRRPLLTLARRMARSPFMRDVQRGLRNRVLPGLGALLVLYVAVVVVRGVAFVALAYGVAR